MLKLAKIISAIGALVTLTACIGYIENTRNNCSYDYFLHLVVSISKIIGGYGPAANQ